MDQEEDSERIALTVTDEQGRRTLDLIRLADIFRRTGKDGFARPDLAEIFNKKAEELSRDLVDANLDIKGARETDHDLKKLVILARDNDIERIILPVAAESLAGKYLRLNIMDGENLSKFYNVQVDLQTAPYSTPKEIADLGLPKETEGARSVFDYGLVYWKA